MREKSMRVIYSISNNIMNIVKINMIWFALNFPIFLIITIVSVTQLINQLLILMFLIFIPVVLFPTTAAMFSVVNQWLIDGESNKVIKKYIFYILRDYKKILKSASILTLLMIIMIVDLIFFVRLGNTIMVFTTLFIILLIFLFFINFLITNSNNPELKISLILKKSLVEIIRKPVSSILVLLTNLLIIFVSFEFIIVVPFFTGVSIATVSYTIYKNKINFKILKRNN